jgi:sentrin-specific protease 2 (axin associating molecule)
VLRNDHKAAYSHAAVARWTDKTDLFSMDWIVVPINHKFHWTLLVVDMRAKTVAYHDSMGMEGGQRYVNVMFRYLQDEHKARKGTAMAAVEQKAWTLDPRAWTPRQLNGVDCGAFVCIVALFRVLGTDLAQLAQEHIPFFRLYIAACIVDATMYDFLDV